MKRQLFLAYLALILPGCTTITHSPPPPLTFPPDPPPKKKCSQIYPEGEWQLVHSISFTSNGNSTKVMGVTTLSEKRLSSALVTVEGLTLFAADFFPDSSYEVHRALPPFDAPHFAEGMMRDIRAIFEPPNGNPSYGQTAEKTPLCRYTEASGRITDVRPPSSISDNVRPGDSKENCWEITRYTADQSLELSIAGRSCRDMETFHLPEHLRLQAHGFNSYTLDMKLLSAESLK